MEEIPESYAIQSQLALPYLPTPQQVIKQIITFLQEHFARTIQQQRRVVDLGAGDGRVVHALATTFPQWNVRGIEINQELSNEGQKLVDHLSNARIIRGDLFQADLMGVDITLLFALPTIMPSMRHVLAPLTKSALIITIQYPLNIPEFPVKEIYKESIQVGNRSFQFFVYQRQ
jgi:16S rRNA A1518/A1519 N6-dimethyltransferase RsmA/KsgA/DIM1 with predicted DNA glycosylase/AP lyase activity